MDSKSDERSSELMNQNLSRKELYNGCNMAKIRYEERRETRCTEIKNQENTGKMK